MLVIMRYTELTRLAHCVLCIFMHIQHMDHPRCHVLILIMYASESMTTKLFFQLLLSCSYCHYVVSGVNLPKNLRGTRTGLSPS